MTDTPKDIQKKEAETPKHGERTRTRRVYTPTVDIIDPMNILESKVPVLYDPKIRNASFVFREIPNA